MRGRTISVAAAWASACSVGLAQTAVQTDPAASAPAAPGQTWLAPRSAAEVLAVAGQLPGQVAPVEATCVELVDLNGPIDGDHPYEVVFTPDGSTAIVCHADTDNITYVDVATRTVTGGTGVGDYPVSVAVTPDGQYALTADVFGNSVSIVDLTTRALVATVPTPAEPYRVEVSADGAFAVVGCTPAAGASSFTVIDMSTLAAVRTFASSAQGVYGFFANSTFPISGFIFGEWRIAPDSTTIVLPASNTPTGTVDFYDLTTGASVGSVVVPSGGRSVDVAQDGSIAVVPCTGTSNRLVVLDVPARSLTASHPTTTNLDAQVQLSADGAKAACQYLNDAFFIDVATGAELSRTFTGIIGDFEITFDGQYVMGSNFNTRLFSFATNSVVQTMTFAATQEMAASPVAHFAVGLNNRFGEQIHLYGTNGASAAFLAALDGGTAPEGDAPFITDISADGTVAIVGMTLSANVAIVDLTTNPPSVRAWVPTGARVIDVAITPDGTHAVTCNGSSNTVSIIDLSTDTVVANLPIFTLPAVVEIAPDSSKAYVFNLAGTDLIHFIQLNGAASAVLGTAIAGQGGSWFGPRFSEESGMALSPDGSILAVCDSFNDLLRLIDTSTRATIAAVPVGDFPIRAAFLPDGSRVYVTNAFTDNVSVVNVAGAGSSVIASIPAGDSTLTAVSDPAGDFVYVTDYAFTGGSRLFVISRATNAVVANISLGGGYARDTHMTDDGTLLVLMGINSSLGTVAELRRYTAAGAATALLDTTTLTNSDARDFAFSNSAQKAVITKPILDALEVACFAPDCPADLAPAPDGDGLVNTNDFFQFLAYYQAMDPRADFSPGGGINTNDFFAFLAAYQLGC